MHETAGRSQKTTNIDTSWGKCRYGASVLPRFSIGKSRPHTAACSHANPPERSASGSSGTECSWQGEASGKLITNAALTPFVLTKRWQEHDVMHLYYLLATT
eukprot:1676948-Amphidinium_carterae.1